MGKFNAKALGWSFGMIEAFFVLISWIIGVSNYMELIDLIGTFYIGFDSTFAGLIIGLVEAMVVGFVAGYLVALVYNKKVAEK